MGIGMAGTLPWPMIREDMKHFAQTTTDVNSLNLRPEERGAQGLLFNSVLKEKLAESGKKASDDQKMNAVVMGRKTWESIPEAHRPLKNRLNVVLTNSPKEFMANLQKAKGSTTEGREDRETVLQDENLMVMSGFEEALAMLSADSGIGEIFVIGGSSLYEASMTSLKDYCKLIITTRINKKFECDVNIMNLENSQENPTFAPLSISETYSQADVTFDYCVFGNTDLLSRRPELVPQKLMSKHPKHAEMQYLEIIDDVIQNGLYKDDRTGTGIFTKFGQQMRFDLNKSFPILTTKDVFWRGLAEELFWFINGDTDAKILSEQKKIKIWDGNASREFLDGIGLKDREEWDLGPVYGFQWRHFGAKYETMHKDYTGEGVDQLAEVINTIKASPNSRRIVMTAWNPSALKEMALPPCHILAQFYVTGDKNPRLSCQMYQRSCDMGLGVPFNIASYALLTCLLAQVCDLERGEFVHTLGDAHVYTNHVEPLKAQLKRMPHPFPLLQLDPEIKDIGKFEFKHLKLINYTHDKKIKMDMAV